MTITKKQVRSFQSFVLRHIEVILGITLTIIFAASFVYFTHQGLVTSYNDARSHLNIARRVVEGLKPGLAQIGSVWLPLYHVLMIPTIWNDYLWHSGLSGALINLFAFVVTGIGLYRFLFHLKVGMLGRLVAVAIFAINTNILYLQAIAMTELLLLATMTLSGFDLVKWAETDSSLDLLKAAFWIMLATLIRYDAWFMFAVSLTLIICIVIKNRGYKSLDGVVLFFSSLGGIGIVLWLLWNLLIFNDPLYFAYGPFSAHQQQLILLDQGMLPTKGDWALSITYYIYAMFYNIGAFTAILGLIGMVVILFDRKIHLNRRIMLTVLLSPLIFNILALYLGHSVMWIQNLTGDTWFNIRYGIMMMPAIAIGVGILVDRLPRLRLTLTGLLLFTTMFMFVSGDAVTVDDAIVGASQKNVSEVSQWLKQHATNQSGFVLISAASHDAVIFSSGLPMDRFIHEGTGEYWDQAIQTPSRWVRWIVLRPDTYDLTYRQLKQSQELDKYTLIGNYPFASVYEIKAEYLSEVLTTPTLSQKP